MQDVTNFFTRQGKKRALSKETNTHKCLIIIIFLILSSYTLVGIHTRMLNFNPDSVKVQSF